MNIIEVRGLRKTYGATVAVGGLDLDVAEGEILGILGPNGSGKTTTVECIAGLRIPDAGTVRVAGLDPARERDKLTRLVGVQLQQAGLQAKLTVREAIGLYASFYERPQDGIQLAERLGLDGNKLDTAYQNLSGGQKQRLAIVLALIGRPRVALLDELSTGLDPRNRREVWAVVEDLRKQGSTILLVTHFMEEAQHLCDRLAFIDRGRITALDTVAGIVAKAAAPTVMSFQPSQPVDLAQVQRIGGVSSLRQTGARIEANVTDEAVLAILDWLRARNVRPERLRIHDSTLDQVYLDLTGQTDTAQVNTARANTAEEN